MVRFHAFRASHLLIPTHGKCADWERNQRSCPSSSRRRRLSVRRLSGSILSRACGQRQFLSTPQFCGLPVVTVAWDTERVGVGHTAYDCTSRQRNPRPCKPCGVATGPSASHAPVVRPPARVGLGGRPMTPSCARPLDVLPIASLGCRCRPSATDCVYRPPMSSLGYRMRFLRATPAAARRPRPTRTSVPGSGIGLSPIWP